MDYQIINARFLLSSSDMSNALDLPLSQVAFLGRSNVGKSTLINALCNNKSLAKSSSTPGKTRLINYFEVVYKRVSGATNEICQTSASNGADEISLVSAASKTPQTSASFGDKITIIFTDLPGFGYAKVSKSLKAQWDKNLDAFLRAENKIRLFLHLIDSRHYDLQIDKGLDDYLGGFVRANQAVLKVFTKCDKLNQSELAKLKNAHPNALFVSAKNKKNIDFLQRKILQKTLGLD